MKTEHVTNMVCEHGGLRRKCGVCEITSERDLLRRQVATVETERDRIANQYAELAEIFRGTNGMDHDWAVSNAACAVSDLYETTEERNGMRQERDLLRRQVLVMAIRISGLTPPESFGGYLSDWGELTPGEQTMQWVKWSIEQAKGGCG